MDGDWEEVTRIAHPPPGVHGLPTQATAVTFDDRQELLWTGNDFGRVASFYGPELQPYTRHKAQPSANGAIRQILVTKKGILSLGAGGLHLAERRGPPIWDIRPNGWIDMQCMCFTSKQTEVLVAGRQNSMYVVDIVKGEVVKELPTEHHYTILRSGRHIYGATVTGSVDILDPLTYKIIKTWPAHSAMINDMDVQHGFIVTCGYSLRQGQTYMLDPYVNVFDLRAMSSITPIAFPAGAAFVRMHPRMNTTSIVVSQLGQMHIVDLMNPNTSNVKHANILSYVTTFEIASSGEAMLLQDAECNIHLWGSPSKIHFADLSMPIEFPDQPEELPSINWTDSTPLNLIGMPYYKDTLLSAWPSTLISEVGAPPVKFDPQFVASHVPIKDTGIVYGPNTRGLLRNQVVDTRAPEKGKSALKQPKFLSEKARETASSTPEPSARTADAGELTEGQDSGVPSKYHQLEIKYSKFGIDDFDFGFYNETAYSGLETQVPNVYANPLLQILHYTPLVRNLALRHAASSCIDATCLLCELGYLSDNLQKAEGSVCHATNMLKMLNCHTQAAQLGLLDEDSRGSLPGQMIQGLSRFLLDQFVKQFQQTAQTDDMERVFQTTATNTIKCTSCRSESTRPSPTNVNDLIYTVQSQGRNQKTPVTFSQILKSSVERETVSKGWCSRCSRYQNISNRKTIHSIPSVFVLNVAIGSAENKRLWATPGWLPEEIGIIIKDGKFFCYEKDGLEHHLERGMYDIAVYSLVGVVVDVDLMAEQQRRSHLVAMVNVGHAEKEAPAQSQWHLFNDFLVRPIPREEALSFAEPWKTPAVLVFQAKSANNKIDLDWRQHLDTGLLFHDFKPDEHDKTYRPLNPETEMPGRDTLIALDTEFVSVRPPELEINSDGARSTVRPIAYALARASVVRGDGEDAGVAFIDDYVEIKEPIDDYLTSYSGIRPSDLNPQTTTRSLLPLKIVFKRLWLLSNLGCRFVGHGLKQDFRVINIYIPKSQIIDTIDLFFLKSRYRKLSLAFLAWVILKEEIQTETHDSIEDSRTALALYRKYLEYVDAGILESRLHEIYQMGERYKFKPPKRDGASDSLAAASRTDTPPVPGGDVPGAGGASAGAPAVAGPSTPSRRGLAGGSGGGAMGGGGSPAWTPGTRSPFR